MRRTSRRDGSSFQKAQTTSPKSLRRRIAPACSWVGCEESALSVEPCPTRTRALSGFDNIESASLTPVTAVFYRQLKCCAFFPPRIASRAGVILPTGSSLYILHKDYNIQTLSDEDTLSDRPRS